MDKLLSMIKGLIEKKFWGKLTIVFENGRPVHWSNKTTGRF